MRRLDRAQRTPVVLVHGTAGKPAQWTRFGDYLEGSHEVRMPTLPGYAEGGWSQTGGRVVDEAHAVLLASLDAGEKVHLVGHSYGGAIALKIAMAWPDRVQSLTLIEPTVFHLLRDGSRLDRSIYADIATVEFRLREAAATGCPASGMSGFIDFWLGKGNWQALAAEKRDQLVAQADRVIGNFTSVLGEKWTVQECARLQCPVIGMIGTESPYLAQHLTRLIIGETSDGRLIPIAGAGHMLPFTHSELVAKIVSRHFARSELMSLRYPRAA